MSGFLLSAATSGAGKTVISLAVMRLLKRRGVIFSPAKSGPDYIDPKFHTQASGIQSINLDAWAMSPSYIQRFGPNAVIEGAMGLFDGAGRQGKGSSADVAALMGLPYVLILDAAKTAHSLAAIARGIMCFRQDITCVGFILNRVGSAKHEQMLRHAFEQATLPPVLGAVPHHSALSLPERHLGLVQASELPDLDAWIDTAADIIAPYIDMDMLGKLLDPSARMPAQIAPLRPPAARIAIARDAAFEFSYPHHIQGWRAAGAELSFFSPLGDDAVPECDFVFLPGGYPELHAERLASARRFMDSLRHHAASGGAIYGECGGYMVLGQGLIDAKGKRHQMAGLLGLETSFQSRKLHLGYRQAQPRIPLFRGPIKAHEFHYASTLSAKGAPLFGVKDADGLSLSDQGLYEGRVFGSFLHIIEGFPTLFDEGS